MAGPCEQEEAERQSERLAEKGATADVQEKLSLCASVWASVKWGERHLPPSTLQAVSGSEPARHVGRDYNVTAHPLHGEGQERTAPGGGLALGPGLRGQAGGHSRGAEAQGGRGHQARAGIKPRRWGRKGATAGNFSERASGSILQGARAPQRDRLPGRPSVYAKQKDGLCKGRGGGYGRGKDCVGKISVLWLLFEVLAAPKQTAGLGKNTPQTGSEAAEFSWRLLRLFPLRPQPERKPEARPGEDLAAGGGVGGWGCSGHLEGAAWLADRKQ